MKTLVLLADFLQFVTNNNVIVMVKIDKIFEKDSINIVFGTNNNYAKYLTVALNSLIEKTSANRFYDIIILETDVKENLKQLIKSLAENKANISIRFVNTEEIFKSLESKNLFCHIYFTKEMYLRLFIPDILQDYEKALYIDCDTLIQADVAELFDIDLDDNYIAAVKDFNTIVNVKHYQKINYYYSQVLKFGVLDNYFNSGVLVMNLNEFRRINLIEKTLELLSIHKELLYPDQDLLNIICKNKVKILESGWNYVFSVNSSLIYDNYFIPLAIEWAQGLANQKIIHYLSENKPWKCPELGYSDIWWFAAKKTLLYQDLLKEYFDAHPEHLNNN